MVWLIDIPSRGIYDQLNGINMVPFRVTPGVAARPVPSSLHEMSNIISHNIHDNIEHVTML